MKIALLTSGGVDRSGTHRVIPCLLWLIERLVRHGDEVHVFALCAEAMIGNWQLHGATIHNAGRSHSGRTMLRQMLSEYRRGRFDVIQISASLKAAMIGGMFGRLFRVPTLPYLCSTELVLLPGIPTIRATRKGRAQMRLAMMAAHRIAAQSEVMVDQARALDIDATRIPLGVALDRWPPLPPRRRYGDGKARLLHVGSIVPVKDHAMLLDTATNLKAAGVAFEIDVIGEDVGRANAVQRQAEALGLADHLHFHGFLPQQALRPYFDRADLLLVTSRHEAGPLVALEAAVAGVPTVGTNVGHLAEWAPHAARVVEPGDSSGLARIVIDLLSDEDARIALAIEAQRRALAEDADVTSRRFRDLYRTLSFGCGSGAG